MLFVSHNLKSVTEICDRSLLLDHGKTLAIGDTDSIIRKYLSHNSFSEVPEEQKPVSISSVSIRDRDGKQATFESGATAWVDVEVTAREAVEKLAVVIWFADETQYIIFDTSTERLGYAPFSLQPGGTYRCSFELTLNIAHGSFRLCAAVHRYDIQTTYDRLEPATTIFIGSTSAVRGAVNCFPRLIESETTTPSGESCKV